MKNKIDNRLLIMTAVGTIFMSSGCTSKTLTVSTPNVVKEKKSVWDIKNRATKKKKEECADCYSTLFNSSKARSSASKSTSMVYGYDYSKVPENTHSANREEEKLYANPYVSKEPYLVNNDCDDFKNRYSNGMSTHKTRNFSNKKSIQVGAFRKYAGAKVYAKRYSLLTHKYGVKIKENVKENRPIYRVQIEGFSTQDEAEAFMERYGLDGAFLVSR
jgi:hypothetical protein